MLEIYPFPSLIQRVDFIGVIQHCDKVVGKCIFDNNVLFVISLTRNELYNCSMNYDETKWMIIGPAQDVTYARILRYVSKIIYLT